MLSGYAKKEWMTLAGTGLMPTVTFAVIGWWWLALLTFVLTIGLVMFFRDPERRTPTQRGVVVSPADGRISSVHELEHFEPFEGPAICVRVFLSVFDVHVNRSPCHSMVQSISHKSGRFINALNPESVEQNESLLLTLIHPTRRYPLAAIRHVAGMLARTIFCAVREGQILQRGQRLGIIKLGSTTELYLPLFLKPQLQVRKGQKVRGGVTVVARITTPQEPQGPPGQGRDASRLMEGSASESSGEGEGGAAPDHGQPEPAAVGREAQADAEHAADHRRRAAGAQPQGGEGVDRDRDGDTVSE